MVGKTAAERMKAMRERKKNDYTRLDVFLLNDVAKELTDRAYKLTLTKAEFVTALLNDSKSVSGEAETKERYEANLELMQESHHLTQAKLKELKRKYAEQLVDGKEMERLKAENESLQKDVTALRTIIKQDSDNVETELLRREADGHKACINDLESEIAYLKGLRSDKELRQEFKKLAAENEKLKQSFAVDRATIDRLIAEKENHTAPKPATPNQPVKKTNNVCVEFMPEGYKKSSENKAALRKGFRAKNGLDNHAVINADDFEAYLIEIGTAGMEGLIKKQKSEHSGKGES